MKLHSMIGIAVVGAALALPASATVVVYYANLSGPAEAPPNASPGTGTVAVTIDDILNTMRVVASFGGLTGTTTASHIHCCTAVPGVGTAGVATVTPSFTGFPLGVSSGTYDHTFDMSVTTGSFNNAFVVANGGNAASAFAALISGMNAGAAYFNVHTNLFPGGEIRGFLAVPEPHSVALMLVGLAGLGLASRRRRRH